MYQDPDIRLKKRELEKIEREIGSLQDSKKNALVEYSKQVQILNLQKEQLKKENTDLMVSVSLLSRKKLDLTKSIEETTSNVQKQMLEEIENKRIEAESKIKENKLCIEKLALDKLEIENAQKQLDKELQRIDLLNTQLDERFKKCRIEENKTTTIVNDLQEKAELLKEEVKSYLEKKELISKSIDQSNIELDQIKREYSQTKAKTDTLLDELLTKKDQLALKEEQLSIKEKELSILKIQLNDRQATLERAFENIRGKHGKQ